VEPTATAPPPSRAILRDLLIVTAVGAGIWVTHRLGRIVIVLIVAMFFAYVIAPLVDLAQRSGHGSGRSRRLPRGAAIALVYLLLAGAASGGVTLVWPSAAQQLDAAIASGPAYTESFRVWEIGRAHV